MRRARKLWKRSKVEKSNTDFPTSLGNPQQRGIPTFRTAPAAAVYMTNSYRTDGDISNEFKLVTFLSSYDSFPGSSLTQPNLESDNFARFELTELSPNISSEPDHLEEEYEIQNFSRLACARNAQLYVPAVQPVNPGCIARANARALILPLG